MMELPCGIITVTDRKYVELTGITSVDSFDEYSITLSVSCGTLTVEGEKLTITVLDLDKGKVCASGCITSVYYSGEQTASDSGIISRLFHGKK